MGTEAPNTKITRHFVTIGNRQVHYRRAGKGPPVLLLHQSPKSSRELIPLIDEFSAHFTILAPDTPGNGNSDPIGLDNPTMDDYGDNIALFLDALGLDKVGVYGFHTGACVGGAFASRHPERVHVAILNGFVSLTDEERVDILANYLTEFHPVWDGGHLTWLWARLREQTVFFPWYRPSAATRGQGDMATPDFLLEGTLEFLRAGDEYRDPYGAAFKFIGAEVAPKFRSPTYLCASDWDPLVKHLPRLPDSLPDCVTVQSLGPGRDSVAPWVLEKLKQYTKGPDAPPPQDPKPLDGRPWQDFVAVEGGQLHVRRSDGVGGTPVLIQHDAAGDNTVVDALSRSMVGKRTAFAFDLPGNGESDNTIGLGGAGGANGVTMARYAEVLGQAMDTLGLDAVDFLGMKGGGLVGLELAGQRPGQVKHLCLNGAPYYSDAERKDLLANYSAPIEIDWYGGFLIKCWHMTRDQGLFWPWYRRTTEGIIPGEPHVDTGFVHRRVVALLKSGDMHHHAYQAQFSYPTHDKLRAVQAPVLLAGREGDARTEAAAKGAPQCTHAALPDDVSKWGDAALEFFAA